MEYIEYKNAIRKNKNEFLVICKILKIDYRSIISFDAKNNIFIVGDKIYYVTKSSDFEHDLFKEMECFTNDGLYVMFEMMPEPYKEVKVHDDFAYYMNVSNLWQKTTKEAYDNCYGISRIKIHKEWFNEAWEALHNFDISYEIEERIKYAIEVQ